MSLRCRAESVPVLEDGGGALGRSNDGLHKSDGLPREGRGHIGKSRVSVPFPLSSVPLYLCNKALSLLRDTLCAGDTLVRPVPSHLVCIVTLVGSGWVPSLRVFVLVRSRKRGGAGW